MDYRKHHSEYLKEQVFSKALDRQLIWRLLGYLQPYRLWLAAALFFLLISKLIEAGVPIFIGHISQKILDSSVLDASQKSLLMDGILRECFLILGLFLFSYAFDLGNVILRSWIGQKALYTLRMRVYRHMLRMPLSYFDKHSVGRLMTRTIHDIDQINQMFAESVIPILGNLFLYIGIFIGIVIIDWQIAVFVIAIMPLVWWLTHRFRCLQRRCYERIRTVVSAMNTFVQEHLLGISTVRNFGLQAQARRSFEEINEDQCNAYMESIGHFGFFIAAIELMQNSALIIAFALIVIFTPHADGFQAGTYFTFSLYAMMFFRPLADLAERYNVLQSAMAAAARIFDLLDTHSEQSKDHGAIELDEIETIIFNDVWFAYEADNWVLKGLSLSLNKGESAALVGMTGEGKSTIMALLLRFYERQKGQITINGRDIGSYSLASLRSRFGIVLQDPVIFSGSFADNIALFNPEIGRKDIERVINYLEMGPFISRFPAGLDHMLSEQGKSLSAGERQMVSLARAVAHRRSVLILDEATANIDTTTEHVIQQALEKILTSTTAIVVAHRLSTIKDVSRIFVLQAGTIVEQGNHDGLMAKKGVYEKLYRLQFSQ